VKRQRADTANAYFRANAEQWDHIRSLHIDEREVEAAAVEALGAGDLLDLAGPALCVGEIWRRRLNPGAHPHIVAVRGDPPAGAGGYALHVLRKRSVARV
jgi:hypothetical protein